MRQFRHLSYATLCLAFAQIVFGAIVRITGSGMGCGDDWPKCLGAWFPPLDRADLIIEISHRYIALALSIAVVALLIMALIRRKDRGVSGVAGRGGILAPTATAAALVLAAALLGAATVKFGLHPLVIVAHLAIAMALLAVLALITVRSGGLGGSVTLEVETARTHRAARIAVAMAFPVLVLGAITANLPGAAISCGGFPWCRSVNSGGIGLAVQIVHRVLAFLLFGHLWGIAAAVARRREPTVIVRAARVAFGSVLAQIVVAAAMVEMTLPAVLRSLHQTVGTFAWLAIVVLAILSAASPGLRTGSGEMRVGA